MPTGFQLNPSFSFTLLGTFAIYLSTRPTPAAGLSVVLVAVALRTACAKIMGGFGNYYGVAWISWGAFLGLAGLIALAAQALRGRGNRRVFYARTFYAGAVFPLLGLVAGYSIPLNVWLRPKTFDPFLLAFDGALGFQPSFWLGRILVKSHSAWGWTTVVYYALPFSGILLYASYRINRTRPVAMLALLLSFMIVGFAQYGVCPAVGPAHAFPDSYPQNDGVARTVALQPATVGSDPRNCMPSLHLGVALLVWWNSRIWPKWGRLLAGLFFLATAFSTLALGEHYLVDLVVAFPFTLAFQAACTTAIPLTSERRRTPLVAGVVLTVVWLVLLRYAIPIFQASVLLSWTLVLATIGWSVALESRLASAVQSQSGIEITPAKSVVPFGSGSAHESLP